jgi:hypothetical protein
MGDVARFGTSLGSGRPWAARRIGRTALALAGLVGAVWPAVSGGQPVTRHSGRVERVDLDEGLVLVSELVARGRARQQAFVVSQDTAIVSSARLRSWQSHDEIAVSLVDLLSGDFVVVDSVADGARLVALRITIVEARAPARRAP